MQGKSAIVHDSEVRWLVFTDLDGTLLDHVTYDWRPAAAALALLERAQVPVILVSSKTLAELRDLRSELNLAHPVVAENGAAIELPPKYFDSSLSMTPETCGRADLQQHFRRIREQGHYDCEAFYELGPAGIARETGLSLERARLANQRLASEPILWRDSEERLTRFTESAARLGLRCLRGGRFVHLMGQVDKSQAMATLLAAYRAQWPEACFQSIALGDGPNDLDMLRAADVAVVVPGRHGQPMPMDGHSRVLRPSAPGPAGWAEAIHTLFPACANEQSGLLTGDSEIG